MDKPDILRHPDSSGQDPFRDTAEFQYFYPSEMHADVVRQIVAALRSDRRVVVLTGETGTGKTALLPLLCERLIDISVARIFLQPLQTGASMPSCTEYGSGKTAGSFSELVTRFSETAPGTSSSGANTSLLIIDNAEHLQIPHVRDIKTIMRFEGQNGRLLKILLVGRPDLLQKLQTLQKEKGLSAEWQHIALNKMSLLETAGYLQHRLRVAGQAQATEVFTEDAVKRVFAFSGGIPNKINKIGRMCLRNGAGHSTSPITVQVVEEAGIDFLNGELQAVTQGSSRQARRTVPQPRPRVDEAPLPDRQTLAEERLEERFTPRPVLKNLPHELLIEAQKIIENLTTRPGSLQVIGFTSAVPQEGTSTIASLVALVTAASEVPAQTKTGDEANGVILIDGQMSQPTLHKFFSGQLLPGLEQVLNGQVTLDAAIQTTNQPGLSILTSGQSGKADNLPLKIDRLGDTLRELSTRFSHVFIDIAPVLHRPEALRICKLCDAVVLVVRARQTRWQVADQAARLLQTAKVNLLGSVLNQREFLIPESIYRKL